MVFSSYLFLFGFLPLCLVTYLVTPQRFKNLMLLIWSLIFYAWGTFSFFPIFIGGCLVDFLIAHRIVRANTISRKQTWVAFSVALNLGILFYFKYSNFFVHEINACFKAFNLDPIVWQSVILPIGISFITFQRISYIVDIYRGVAQPAKNFINYFLYIALFPQLIAGPIVRYHDIAEQLLEREHSLENVWRGATRFCLGLSKKVLIADALGNVTANVNHLGAQSMTLGYAWLGVICYGLQLYFDFSGYSDMAIGLGRIFGFKFLENFNMPFISQTFTEFWRRWHISLSRVMLDYLYIPLGGNRVGKVRSVVNLWIVFLASGIWHGANWTYLAFGAYHGFFMTIDKFGWKKCTEKIAEKWWGRWFNIILTLFFLQIGWAIFKSNSISEAWTYLGYMFNGSWHAQVYPLRSKVIHNEGLVVLITAVICIFLPQTRIYKKTLSYFRDGKSPCPQPVIDFLYCTVMISLCAVVLSATRFTPFIYFQF